MGSLAISQTKGNKNGCIISKHLLYLVGYYNKIKLLGHHPNVLHCSPFTPLRFTTSFVGGFLYKSQRFCGNDDLILSSLGIIPELVKRIYRSYFMHEDYFILTSKVLEVKNAHVLP